MKSFIIGNNDNDVRLSRFVVKVCANIPNDVLYKGFRNKRIKVNGKKANPETRLQKGDLVELYINDEYFAAEIEKQRFTTDDFDFVYDDDLISILYKPAGLLSHSAENNKANLLDSYIEHLIAAGEYKPQNELSFTPAICNRLDYGTEGLLIGAKTYPALREVNNIIKEGLLKKQYRCICVNKPPEGVFNGYLSRDKKNKTVKVQSCPDDDFKEIKTGVKILDSKGSFFLCEIDLITGRTHQIRAHLAFLGSPVLGDSKYGDKNINKQLKLRQQCLCASSLTFSDCLADNGAIGYLKGKQFNVNKSQTMEFWHNL